MQQVGQRTKQAYWGYDPVWHAYCKVLGSQFLALEEATDAGTKKTCVCWLGARAVSPNRGQAPRR